MAIKQDEREPEISMFIILDKVFVFNSLWEDK